jgi:hypothetical protein
LIEMPLDGFDSLYRDADARTEPVKIAAAGGDASLLDLNQA